jgi:hypothetical protein
VAQLRGHVQRRPLVLVLRVERGTRLRAVACTR